MGSQQLLSFKVSGPRSNGNEEALYNPGLESHHQMVLYHIQEISLEWGSYPSAKMQSMYSTVPKPSGLLEAVAYLRLF